MFVSKMTFKVSQYLSMDLSDTKALRGNALKVEWLVGLRYAFPLTNLIHLVLGRLVKWEGELIMVTPC